MSPDFHLNRHRRTLAVVLAVALVLAQLLGVLHRVAHHGRSVAQAAATAQHADSAPAVHWLAALFDHDQDGGCDLYDQLTHADAVWGVAALVLPAAAPTPPAVVHRAWHLAVQAAGALARGPPALG